MRRYRWAALVPVVALLLFGCVAGTSQAAAPESMFGAAVPSVKADSDSAKVELGVQFKASVAGQVTAVRFYKGAGNTGTHTGSLWQGSTRKATGTFTGETATGWQTLTFATPVAVTAGTVYTASYLAPRGHYAVNNPYAFPKVSGNLTAVKGVYVYGGGNPTQSYQTSNYWVDVTFVAAAAPTSSSSSASSSTPTTTTSTTTTSTPATTTTATTPPPTAGFPDATTTGWAHTGVTLLKVPGQVTAGAGWEWDGSFGYVKITGANAVLDGLDISGCVYVDAGVSSATITRSRISGGCDYLIRRESDSGALTVRDTELVGGAVQVKGANFTWTGVDAHHFTGKAAMLGTNSVVEDSYLHDNQCNPPDHQSAVGTNGAASHMIIRRNNVDLSPSDCTSGGVSNYDDFGAFHDLLIEGNLINSAGYCLKAGFEDGNAAGNTGERVIGNTFGRKYFAECGYFGVVSNWMAAAGNEWSGNVWGGGAAATSSHAVGDTVNP